MLQSAMLLRQSNGKLQEELKDTMKAYGEEKSMLRAQLANLRLDLTELHHDDRTVTTEETGSHFSMSNSSDPELKRLADFDGDTNRSLQLPIINNLAEPLSKSGRSGIKDNSSHRKKKKDQTSKNLRFTTDEEANAQSFLENPSWETKQETQKFLELQRNQEVLRNIGRAHLKEKRQSLIRLPTISSAKKRSSLWDSGRNVSRPKGKSTIFELHPYVEHATVLNKKHFQIPSIKDPQRSEIILKGPAKRPAIYKRKVQFTRPREEVEVKRREVPDPAAMETEANSLNTSMAEVSLEDNTLGNITFDDETFKNMMKKTALDDEDLVEKEEKTDSNTTKTANDDYTDQRITEDADKPALSDEASLPPLKVKSLAKKNLELHNLNNMRVSPLNLSTSPDVKSCRDSDRSVGTKLSQMSQQTERQKTTYLKDIDPKKRNQTLTDIMFAVRSRMRENEDAIRFGQTPRPQDRRLDEYLMHKLGGSNNSSVSSLTPRWVNGNQSKGKVTKRGPGYKTTTDRSTAKRKSSSTAEVQSYLRKMYRQRKTIDRMTGTDYKFSHFAGHKQLRMVAQQA